MMRRPEIRGFISVTPLSMNMTHYETRASLEATFEVSSVQEASNS